MSAVHIVFTQFGKTEYFEFAAATSQKLLIPVTVNNLLQQTPKAEERRIVGLKSERVRRWGRLDPQPPLNKLDINGPSLAIIDVHDVISYNSDSMTL